MAKFLLIDAMNLMFRAKHVTRGDAYEKAGLAVSIALTSIRWAFNKFEADHIVFCLDSRSWRKDVYKGYKANRAVAKLDRSQREIDEETIFFEAMDDFMQFIKANTNCTVLKREGCEADDFIARWIQIFGQDLTNEFTIVSSDTDFAQLMAHARVQIYDGVNKRLYTDSGVFDEKMKPVLGKDKKPLPPINGDYLLFEKCVRGDSSDNIPSAFPGVRTKGSKKKAGIEEAYRDRDSQGYDWINFMRTKWEDPMGVEHIVEDDFKRNQELIDLTRQPDEIKEVLDATILSTLQEPKEAKMIGMHFLKFCGKHELNKLAEQTETIVPMLAAGFNGVKL